MPRGKSPWVGDNSRTGHPSYLVSLCPTSTSSYTLSSWETAAVNQNAGRKIIRRCHFEPGAPNNLLQRKIWAAARHSTPRGQGNAKGASGLPTPSKGPAQGRVFGFVSCVYEEFSAWVWPSSSMNGAGAGAGAAAKPQLCPAASPGRAPILRTWVCSLQHNL